MKKIIEYSSVNLFKKCLILFFFIILAGTVANAQVQKVFAPRTSTKAPGEYKGVSNYYLQGDFKMIGNTNLTLASYTSTAQNGNNNMIFVDKDGDANTFNSSSATLQLVDAACSEIIYAGLYWSGRAHIDGASPNPFNVTKNGETRSFDKAKVKLKKAGGTYQNITAASGDIRFPSNTDGNMYAAYADVTDYVREQGVGEYFVADMALREGNGGGTGYYGGWGMVVIYKNTTMKWRDITVFDGYAYVVGGNANHELPVSGFRASQNGDVKVTMGMMAGEGDRSITGDYFQIRNATNNWVHLNHDFNKPTTTTNNFFNSSIYTGGNYRNPNLLNNTGMDVIMFDLINTDNSIIANNQTSTRFRYGSTQDTYIIYNIVFAVDAYVPMVIGENSPSSGANNQPPVHDGIVEPGQELEFNLDVINKGEEGVNNTKIEIPVPYNLHFSGADITSDLPLSNGTVTWEHPSAGPNDYTTVPGGTIVWQVGNLPYDATKKEVQAQLKYRFKVTNNCVLLATSVGDCGLDIHINGTVTGKGATSGSNVNSSLVRDYGNDACEGPVYDDFKSTISVSEAYILECSPPLENREMVFKGFCSLENNEYPRDQVLTTEYYPVGTKFFSQQPESYESTDGLISGGFPVSSVSGERTTYYGVAPGMDPGCYLVFYVSLEKVTTKPTVQNVEICQGEELILNIELSQTGQDNGYTLYYFDKDQILLTEQPTPTAVGTHQYFVAEGVVKNYEKCIGKKTAFTITINELPEIDTAVADIQICNNNDHIIEIDADAGSYTWWYKVSETADTWMELKNNSFANNQVVAVGKKLSLSHATMQLNGIVLRMEVDSGTCVGSTNEIILEIKNCKLLTNPILINRGLN